MSWVVEQSENASAVSVHHDTITCNSKDGSLINVLYKDPASENGEYFWQIKFEKLCTEGGQGASVGLTTDEGFQAGWDLKGMKYLGNLSDGGSLLVPNFGDSIQQNDTLGLLLKLTDADMKFYIFHNEKALGLAFHIQSPYPKPLYPLVSFHTSDKATISRSKQIPTLLDRKPTRFTGIEGDWKIVTNDQHPETIGVSFHIKKQDANTYDFHSRVCNNLNCTLEHDPSNNQVKVSPIMRSLMGGPPEEMKKESSVNRLISHIQSLTNQGEHQLILQTNDNQQVQLERFQVPPPSPVTNNIFN